MQLSKQLPILPTSRPLALGLILASALLTGISISPLRSQTPEITGRSRAPIILQSDQLNPSTGVVRARSIAPVSLSQSETIALTALIDTTGKRSRVPITAN